MIQQSVSRRGQLSGRSAFTMVELLIVIVVIGLLVGISLTVAVRATSSGKVRATENILKAVDQVITEYAASTDGKIPAFYTDQTTGFTYPMVDGVPDTQGFTQPSLSLFLAEASKLRLTDRMLQNIDSQFMQRQFVPAAGWGPDGSVGMAGLDGLVVLDGFGRPIRLVHPAFHGGYGLYHKKVAATGSFTDPVTTRLPLRVERPVTAINPSVGTPLLFRRSCLPLPFIVDSAVPQGDADEGRCIANRPYVYSCGIDGNPGTRMDNIYVNGKPQWPGETASIFVRDP